MARETQPIETLAKAGTGIAGLDEITAGGWPRGRATLIEGGSGSGKTVLALQTLVNGAVLFNEPGIFVAFEESSKRIVTNAARFGWDLPGPAGEKAVFSRRPPRSRSGSFRQIRSGRFAGRIGCKGGRNEGATHRVRRRGHSADPAE